MASAAAIETTAVSIVDAVGATAKFVLTVGQPALPIVQFVAGFVPGLAPAVQVLSVAMPILSKVATGAPIVAQAIEQNKPLIEALINAAPDVTDSLKKLYALAVDADPTHQLHGYLTEADVTGVMLESFISRNFFTPQDPRFNTGVVG